MSFCFHVYRWNKPSTACVSISQRHRSQHSPRGLKESTSLNENAVGDWALIFCVGGFVSNGRRVVCMCPQGEGRNTDKVPFVAGVEWMCWWVCATRLCLAVCDKGREDAADKYTQELKWASAYVDRNTLAHLSVTLVLSQHTFFCWFATQHTARHEVQAATLKSY